MSLSRPLDPAFPIDRQIAIDAKSVVLVNVFTLDRAVGASEASTSCAR